MGSSLLENSGATRCNTVRQGGAVAPTRGGATQGLRSRGPVAPAALHRLAVPAAYAIKVGCCAETVRWKAESLPEPWPPADLALPSTIEGIEAGRQQREQPTEQPDDSRVGRLARLLGDVPDQRRSFAFEAHLAERYQNTKEARGTQQQRSGGADLRVERKQR
jgi:hypothetical protein